MQYKYTTKQYLQDLSSKEQLKMMEVDFYDDLLLDSLKISDGYILPTIMGDRKESWRVGGVLDQDRNYIDESAQYAFGEKTRVYGKYEFNQEDVEYIDDEVIYMNNFIDQWGHYLLDVIGRLWYAIKHKNIKIAYTSYLNETKQLNNNFLQLIKLLGIEEDRLIYINSIKQFKTVIVPTTSILTAKYYTKEYKELIDTIVESALAGYKLKNNKKIYCSRGHFTNKRTSEFGENVIESVFKENGYEIIHMEELDLISQIRLLNECKEIVCLSGTLVHNAMFIKNSNCHITILNKSYKINLNIYLTNQISSANFTFIDTYLSPLPVSLGKGPYILTITKEFISFCQDNKIRINKDYIKVDYINIIKYYYSYFNKYKSKIINNKEIGNSKYDVFRFNKTDIKRHFKNEIRILKGI